MANVLGPLALIDIAMPTGTDPSEIMRFNLEQGITDQQALALAATLTGEVNEQLVSQYGGLVYFTTTPYARYRQGSGVRRSTPLRAEFSAPDAIRGQDIGHMLPRNDFEDRVELSDLFKKRGDPEELRFALQEVADAWKNRVDQDIITRALTNTENAIGSGYDVPWAIGTGTNVNYIPPQYRGYAFTSSHTHFVWKDDASADYDDLLEDMMEELRHHGHSDRLSTLISIDDVETVSALPGFAALEQPNIIIVGGNTASPVRYANGVIAGIPGELIGYYNSKKWGQTEVRYHERIPTGYAFMTKSYGIDNPRNGLAVRVDPEGFGLMVKPILAPSYEREVEAVRFVATHGVGVNSRTGGVAGYIANSATAYVSPSIS